MGGPNGVHPGFTRLLLLSATGAQVFDAHNHLDRCADPRASLEEAREAGVHGQLLAGVDPAGWRAQAALVGGAPDLWAAYGIHPWTAASLAEDQHAACIAELEAALDGALGAAPLALGELGLDRSRHVPSDSLERQEALFRAQLALARDRGLPVVLHIVRAHGRALELLRADGLPARGGMVHSASTPAELVPEYLDLGLHLSFAAGVTRHPRARQAAARVPLDRLLAETDAPDQPPAGHEPPNRPALLGEIVAALATVHGLGTHDMAERTEANARRLFGLPPRG